MNESRKRLNLPPIVGGDEVYLQQQYWPLSQLAARPIPEIPEKPIEQVESGDEDVERDSDIDVSDLETFVRIKAAEVGLDMAGASGS